MNKQRHPGIGLSFDGRRLRGLYRRLCRAYGAQGWWPQQGGGAFEVMVGAVLTQNTAWRNVERAIAELRRHDCLDCQAILSLRRHRLARLIHASGYFNVKAERLHNLCEWLARQGGTTVLARRSTDRLRRELLAINGIGPETADDILLYAFRRPVFVIDTYTRRLLASLGMARGDEPYEDLRRAFECTLATDVALYKEFHALIVRHAKEPCVRLPGCRRCHVEGRLCPLPPRESPKNL